MLKVESREGKVNKPKMRLSNRELVLQKLPRTGGGLKTIGTGLGHYYEYKTSYWSVLSDQNCVFQQGFVFYDVLAHIGGKWN